MVASPTQSLRLSVPMYSRSPRSPDPHAGLIPHTLLTVWQSEVRPPGFWRLGDSIDRQCSELNSTFVRGESANGSMLQGACSRREHSTERSRENILRISREQSKEYSIEEAQREHVQRSIFIGPYSKEHIQRTIFIGLYSEHTFIGTFRQTNEDANCLQLKHCQNIYGQQSSSVHRRQALVLEDVGAKESSNRTTEQQDQREPERRSKILIE